MRFCPNLTLVLLAAGCIMPSASAQDIRQLTPIAPTPTATYPDSPDGLHHLLQDMLAAAKPGDHHPLQTMIVSAEIPDYETWFPAIFGAQKGNGMAALYRKTFRQREADFQDQLTKLADREGYFTTKEIVATDLYDTLQKQLDVFLASWSPPDSAGLPRRPKPMAYFFFVDGKFRLDTNDAFAEAPPGPAQNKP